MNNNNESCIKPAEALRKSKLTAYLLLIFLGLFGVHRLYLQRWVSGFVYLALFMLAMIVFEVLVVYALLLGLAVDLFLIPGMTKQCNERLAQEFEQHPERFAKPGSEQIAPWARNAKPGLLHVLGTPVRITQFILLPVVFTLIMVLTANYEIVIFPVIILLATGLLTSLDRLSLQYPSLLKLPGVKEALARERELRQYYWNNEPRLAGSLLGMITRARTEYAPYWKIIGVIVVAILIDGVFSFNDDYAPYLSFSDAFSVIGFHMVFVTLAVLIILSPLGALSYHYSLSGKRSRLRVLTLAALGMIGLTFYLGTEIEREPGQVSLFSGFRLDLRMENEDFRAALNDNVSMFLVYYSPALDDMTCVTFESRNSCEYTAWLRELLKGMAPNDENESFEVFDTVVEDEVYGETAWRGVRYNNTSSSLRTVIAATDGDILCQPLFDAESPAETEEASLICNDVLPGFLNLPGDLP